MGLFSSKPKAPPAELGQDFSVTPPWARIVKETVQVYFDIEIDGSKAGRIEMTLAHSIVPKT